MDPDSRESSSTRKWWLLIGGFVVFVMLSPLLESLIRREPGPSTPAEDTDDVFSPAPPELIRLDDGVEIRHDIFRRTTIRLGDEEAEQALFDCLEQGIEQTFGDGIEGWTRSRIFRETERIQEGCMGHVPGIPVPPRLPRPGRRSSS